MNSPPQMMLEGQRRIWRAVLILVAVGILYAVGYRAESERTKYSRAHNDIAELQTDLEHFRSDNGRYPSSAEGLGSLFNTRDIDPGIESERPSASDPMDPWGHPYFYQSDG